MSFNLINESELEGKKCKQKWLSEMSKINGDKLNFQILNNALGIQLSKWAIQQYFESQKSQDTMDKLHIQILEISPEKMKFSLSGCDISLANALRRVLISQVPTMAPHLVSIIQNTSVLHDEWLCQRIGLIPFISDKVQDFKYPWECPCSLEGVQDCRVCKQYFILNVKNTDQQVMEVTSLHIRPVFESMNDEQQRKRSIRPVPYFSNINQNTQLGIPIVKLARNQQINIRFDVQKGIGKMHAKWAPCALATYHPQPQIKVDDSIDITVQQKKAIKESCPTRVFDVRQNLFQVVHPQSCIFCGECKKTAQSFDLLHFKNYISIGKKKDKFIFTVQSVGQLHAAAIVKKSMSVLRAKLKDLNDRIQ